MSRKSMQADIDTLYAWLDQQQQALDNVLKAVQPPAVGVAEYIGEWRVKLDLLRLYEGNVDLAQSALEWLFPSDDKATTGEAQA
ncbi:hypothetical protein SEA_CULVER_90 [Gordonia phage Culver]|nr:hypothetical protein SEA_CULVER_90 [Gordonia phage Culver]